MENVSELGGLSASVLVSDTDADNYGSDWNHPGRDAGKLGVNDFSVEGRESGMTNVTSMAPRIYMSHDGDGVAKHSGLIQVVKTSPKLQKRRKNRASVDCNEGYDREGDVISSQTCAEDASTRLPRCKSAQSNIQQGTLSSSQTSFHDGDGGSTLSYASETVDPDSGDIRDVSGKKILQMCQRSEWNRLEQALRFLPHGCQQLNFADVVTGVTPLMIVVRENKLAIAEKLLELGVKVNTTAKDGSTAMHFCAAHCKEDMVKLLINKKADLMKLAGTKERLPIHIVSARASPSVINVAQLIIRASDKDARVQRDKDGIIALFLAAECGNVAVCRELLADMAAQQLTTPAWPNGDRVQHMVSRSHNVELMKVLLDAGAHPDAQNDEGQTVLHIAACNGDDAMIRCLQTSKADPNIVDKLDRSPLHMAAECGHTGVVELLVDKFRSSVLARTKDGSTMMHVASHFGHSDTALMFLKKGVPLHMPNKSGALCLHAAASTGHTSVVRALIMKGANVDSKTKDGYTALHVAVEHVQPQVIQILLGFGAAVELKGGKVQETPLHIAARISNGDICANMLLKSGANVSASQENGETALHIAAREGHHNMVRTLLEDGANPMQQSKMGETGLHIAVRHCHLRVVREIIEHTSTSKSKIDAVLLINTQNSEGETCVHLAAEIRKSQTHADFEDTDIFKILMDYHADVNIQTKITQETAMHYCGRAGNEDILWEMAQALSPSQLQGVINQQAKNGWTPLLCASDVGHVNVITVLLKYHARIDVFDEQGKAALHLAAENGHEKVADILLCNKAFVNAKSKLGLSPLHLASLNGYNDLVTLLVKKHHANISATCLAKKTPLHMAAQRGRREVCRTLLKLNTDATARDHHGRTPLHLAAENDHAELVRLFLKHNPDLVSALNGMTCAHIAVAKGSVRVIKELTKFNKNTVLTVRDRATESTALHLATAGGHKEVVSHLIDMGFSVSDENAEGMTALHLAAKYGCVDILGALSDKVSWNICSKKTGMQALHIAAYYGQTEFLREMLTRVPATVRSHQPTSLDTGLKNLGGEYGFTPLHLASLAGHEAAVRLLLNSPGVQADATTHIQALIPLHLAAQNGYSLVVSLLLSKSTTQLHVKDKRGRTVLHLASSNGHIDIITLLLAQGADINTPDKNGWTALHYAARSGNLNVVKTLIETGAVVTYVTKDGKSPVCYSAAGHHSECLSYLLGRDNNAHNLMKDKKFVFDLMTLGRINNNRSIQEFILLSPAPINTAVKLSHNFRLLAIREKERSKDLLLAGDYSETMAADLVAIASGISSAGRILRSIDEKGSPFLDVLIENEQKQVVAHPSVQIYLTEVWMGSLRWKTWRIIMLFIAFVLIPPVWAVFSLPLRHRFNRVPIIKFMSYLVSHIYLILLYCLIIVYPLTPISRTTLIPQLHEWLLLAWLSGLLVSELTNPGDRAGLGWIKVIVLAISLIGIICHLISYIYSGNERLTIIYIRNQFFAWALSLCFVQCLDFLSFHHQFGPWAIIIRDLMVDLMRFIIILLIFMTGFTLHMTALYQPVYPETSTAATSTTATTTTDSPSFTKIGKKASTLSVLDMFELLFFALFGLIDPESLPSIERSPAWVATLVKIVFITFLIITIIVLINLLIAMMSDTYQRIQTQSDTEWKFGRAKLIRNMNKTSATPSPLNLFTKMYTYIRVMYRHKCEVCGSHGQEYINEEEQLDTLSDGGSVDYLGHASSVWHRHIAGRNSQVVPEGHASRSHGARTKVEDVVDWSGVVSRYLDMHNLSKPDEPPRNLLDMAIDRLDKSIRSKPTTPQGKQRHGQITLRRF